MLVTVVNSKGQAVDKIPAQVGMESEIGVISRITPKRIYFKPHDSYLKGMRLDCMKNASMDEQGNWVFYCSGESFTITSKEAKKWLLAG